MGLQQVVQGGGGGTTEVKGHVSTGRAWALLEGDGDPAVLGAEKSQDYRLYGTGRLDRIGRLDGTGRLCGTGSLDRTGRLCGTGRLYGAGGCTGLGGGGVKVGASRADGAWASLWRYATQISSGRECS